MQESTFQQSAQFIVKRNVSERVRRALATFHPETGHLSLTYCIEGQPTDRDAEDCELACAELIAEFPQIMTAEAQCLPSDECNSLRDQNEVYSKPET